MPLRPATAADYPAFARLFPELETGDDVPSRRTWEHQLAPHSLILERDEGIAGYIFFQILDGLGYVRHVIVDPAHRGHGVGKALMRAAALRIREAGIDRWCLNVKLDNEPAIGLYRRMGMTRRHASVSMRMGWDIIERLPAPDPELVVGPLAPDDEAEAEQALALPVGVLATQRGHASAHLLLCRRGSTPVGMAVFTPNLPGAYPFRARSAAVAHALLLAMRPHTDPTRDFVQLVFEDQPEVAAAFDEAGATRHLEFVHLAGPVPSS